ncbi:SAM-dependent methyltransferase [Candidatus Poribacteria bacterium]|nr:SAM-dependent methyltransferase [Candidatus Poribacteria bacterium]
MVVCRGCQSGEAEELLDIGMHPVSNCFLPSTSVLDPRYLLVIGQCRECGLVQLTKSMPANVLSPIYEWITYNEPEGHLDALVDRLTRLQNIDEGSLIAGVSYKDDTTLQRFNRLGFDRTWRLDVSDDLMMPAVKSGIETVQGCLNSSLVLPIIKKYGLADIMIVRHVVEHAYKPVELIEALRQLVKPTGYLVFEVPDCTKVLETLDYSAIWEEHLLYFTPETFRNFFGHYQFSLVDHILYSYSHENSLVAIVQPSEGKLSVSPPKDALKIETARANNFFRNLGVRKRKVKEFLSQYRKNYGKIAIFGAGHLACMFLNLMEIGEFIDFVVDDFPEKRGLYMPGSKLPIVGSQEMIGKDIRLCLTSLNMESEQKVIQKNQEFIESGGTFASIFPSSSIALPIL